MTKPVTPNLKTESALLMIGCLQAGEKNGWLVKAANQDKISDEGFEAALTVKNPKGHMQEAAARSKAAIALCDGTGPQVLLNAAAMTVLLLALERRIGAPLPELVLSALSVVLDPHKGALLQHAETSLGYMARAFAMKEALEKPVNTPAPAH